MWEQRLGPARGRFGFVCFFSPRGYTTERTRRYFKMPPSSGFPFIHKMSTVGGGGECGPSSPPRRAVCVTFPLIHHPHTRRRIYLSMQQAEEVCGDVWRLRAATKDRSCCCLSVLFLISRLVTISFIFTTYFGPVIFCLT